MSHSISNFLTGIVLSLFIPFPSISGVFIAKGDVGTGTIVGSAVFNILFVIGLCGVFTGNVFFFVLSIWDKKTFFLPEMIIIHQPAMNGG